MNKTAHIIAHATTDENGASWGGDAGCQTGRELQFRRWYQRGWNHVYRLKESVPDYQEKREQIASFMEKAVTNGFIGYDSNKTARDTLFNALLNNGYKVDEINETVECDCASLVYCAVYPVTDVECYISPERKEEALIAICPKVNDFVDYFDNQCNGMFERFDGEEYINSDALLLRGDILISLGNHSAVWI